MRGFYAMNEKMDALGDDKAWDDEKDRDWNGCCEDPCDDEDDDEEYEKEWCD